MAGYPPTMYMMIWMNCVVWSLQSSGSVKRQRMGLNVGANLCFQYAYDVENGWSWKKYRMHCRYNFGIQISRIFLYWPRMVICEARINAYHRYDTLNRPVQTGIYSASMAYTLDAMQTLVNGNQLFPATFTLNTQTFYDDYRQVTVPFIRVLMQVIIIIYRKLSRSCCPKRANPGTGYYYPDEGAGSPGYAMADFCELLWRKGEGDPINNDNISGSRIPCQPLWFLRKGLSTYERHTM